jgi:alpha-1,3-mannosyl-glycoprotein beta-1,2-N-acetylglucosaminyltransferase
MSAGAAPRPMGAARGARLRTSRLTSAARPRRRPGATLLLALAAVACVAGSAFVYDRAFVAGGAGDRARVPHPARADPRRWRRERPSLPIPSRFHDGGTQRLDGVMTDAWNAATSDDDLEPDDDTPADVSIVASDDRTASRDQLPSTSRVPVPVPVPIPGDGSGDDMSDAAILVVAYNRPDYLTRTLESLASVADLHLVSVYVSQDGDDASVARVASGAAGRLGAPRTRGFSHWRRPRVPQLGYGQPGHAYLAQHYKWALDKVFLERGHSHVIVVEDDMLFSPDFVSYFRRTATLLRRDPSLWCVSSWNDNGLATHARDPLALRRTGYFPGLGWMMRRELWEELGPAWPKEHWDHWMRLDAVSRGRECVVPEVNRNFNIGVVGANMRAETHAKYLARMSFNDADHGDFGDLSGLLRDAYSAGMAATVAAAATWPWTETAESPGAWARRVGIEPGRPLLATYRAETYERLAARVDAWPYPRGHSEHAAAVTAPGDGAGDDRVVILADERFCPHLPDELRLRPSAGMTPTPARRNQNCDDACRGVGMRCVASDFWFLNSCEALARRFPCENGCALVLGDDVPNYVVGKELDTFGKCLVTERQSTCRAAHRHTRRLCACA